MRILIVKLGSIGDIVHTLPALAAMRAALPAASIGWVVETRSAEILRGNPLIDELIEVDTRSLRRLSFPDEMIAGLGTQVSALRQLKFDIAIDFQGLLKSAAMTKLSGAKQRWGFARDELREPLSRVLLTDTAEVRPKIHVIGKNLLLAGKALGVSIENVELEFPIATDETHINEADAIAGSLPAEKFALLNPGGGWVTKLWPAERFGPLADRLWQEAGMASVLTTGPGEDNLAESAMAASRSGIIRHAQTSLKGFYELARRCELYVGGDTGPTHIAVAAGAPVVGLFGPTEWWRNGSPRDEDICVERTDIGCRVDCHRRKCDEWICMEISVDAVFAACLQRLQLVGSPALLHPAATLA